MDYTAKILKGIYEIIKNQEHLQKQNKAILRELKKLNIIQGETHGVSPLLSEIEEEDV